MRDGDRFTRRLVEHILQVAQQTIRRGVLDPTLGTDMSDPRVSVELGDRTHVCRQMREIAVRHYQNSTPLVVLSPGMGTFAS